MFCTWRATVCSLITSVCGDLAVALAGGDEAQHLELARASVRGGRGLARPSSESTHATSGAAPSSSNDARGRVELERDRVVVAERRGRRARRARAPARPRTAPASSCHACARPPKRRQRGLGVAVGELDRSARLGGASPRARRSRSRSAISASSRHASRAASTSPTASMISTYAGSRLARRSGVRRLAQRRGGSRRRPRRLCPARAAAAPARAGAPSRTGSPPCTRPPRQSSSPRSRWTSPCR